MATGSRYWASSYIILTSGKKFYLSNTMDDLKEQLRKRKSSIEVETSNLFSQKYTILKSHIMSYGKV